MSINLDFGRKYLNKSVVEAAETLCQQYIPADADAATWQIEKLEQLINITFKHDIKLQEFVDQTIEQEQQLDTDQLHSYFSDTITKVYTDKVHTLEPSIMLDLQRQIVIQVMVQVQLSIDLGQLHISGSLKVNFSLMSIKCF